MPKRKLVAVICTIIFVAVGAGCMSIQNPGGISTITNLQIPTEKYEILKNQEVEGCSSNTGLLGIFWFGNAGTIAAYEDALAQVSGANTLLNAKVDTKTTSILGLYFSSTTVVRGVPARIKYK
ncbi:MAG: TRL domain-containing protein [Planctomycetota bacterium]